MIKDKCVKVSHSDTETEIWGKKCEGTAQSFPVELVAG